MSRQDRRRGHQRLRPRYTVAAALGVTPLLGLTFLVPAATAVTSISGGDPGSNPPVVRGTTVTISDSNGAHFYYRSAATAAAAGTTVFSDVKAGPTTGAAIGMTTIGSTKQCLGDNGAAGHKNNTPRTTITVKDPGNNTVATIVSPARSTSSGSVSLFQPNAPSDTVYRGDFSGTTAHGFSATLDMTGKPAGTYTVTTDYQDRIRTDVGATPGACLIGRPNAAGTGVDSTPRTSTTTFVYRPWQNTFVDMFGNGKVQTNTVPNEFQFTISTGGQTHSSAIYADYEHFYALPPNAPFLLPTDPSCAADPGSCLPSSATLCDPGAGCTPRLVTINKVGDGEALQGVFDLQTKAFIATASLASSSQRQLLVSLGTQVDAQLKTFLGQLEANAASHGIDLAALLATKVRISNGNEQLTLSLLDALQIAPTQAAPGVQIIAAPTVQAGIILDIYFSLSPHSCVTHAGDSSTAPQRFTPSTGLPGFTVEKSDLLPEIPAVGPLGAIASGPIYHITGNFPGGQLAASETATIVTGLDTAADEPNGYPVWVVPFISAPHVATPTKMDFLGTATWSASEKSGAPFAVCTVVDFMLGTGVALYNNPLPVGFGTLLSPAYKPSAASATLIGKVNAAVASVVGQVSTNPAVSGLLTQIVGALP